MISKDDLRINGSDYFKSFDPKFPPNSYVIQKEDEGDPGRICFRNNLPFGVWNFILKYNNVVDPLLDFKSGDVLLIPDRRDIVGFG